MCIGSRLSTAGSGIVARLASAEGDTSRPCRARSPYPDGRISGARAGAARCSA